MSFKDVKSQRDLFGWIIIIMAIFAGWCWMVYMPGTDQIVHEWKKLRAEKSYQFYDIENKVNILEKERNDKEKYFVKKTEIMPSALKGYNSATTVKR